MSRRTWSRDQLAGGRVAELPAVVVAGDDGQLLQRVPREVGSLDLLARNVVENETIEIA